MKKLILILILFGVILQKSAVLSLMLPYFACVAFTFYTDYIWLPLGDCTVKAAVHVEYVSDE